MRSYVREKYKGMKVPFSKSETLQWRNAYRMCLKRVCVRAWVGASHGAYINRQPVTRWRPPLAGGVTWCKMHVEGRWRQNVIKRWMLKWRHAVNFIIVRKSASLHLFHHARASPTAPDTYVFSWILKSIHFELGCFWQVLLPINNAYEFTSLSLPTARDIHVFPKI